MGYKPASPALEGLTVLDLTHARAGPVCVRQLGDWGANVIRIERPGDPADFSARHDSDFQSKHRNKRGIALNLRSDEGRAILYRLIEKADVVVENFRPDVKKRLGFDYETIKAKNPRIILASISAFGQDGPYSHLPGVDQVIQGMSGLMSVTGEPGRGPMRVGIAIADIMTGMHAALGILVAIIERQKSNQGQWVQASLLESQMFTMDLQAARYLVDGVVPKQVGNEHPSGAPTSAYKTKDGYVNIAPIPAMWGRLCKALGREDLIDHPDYATREVRRKRRKEVNALVAEIVAEMDTATLMERLQAAEGPLRADLHHGPGLQRSAGEAHEAHRYGDRDRWQRAHPGAATLPAQPHAQQARPPNAGIRRAHRRGTVRVWILRGGDQRFPRTGLG